MAAECFHQMCFSFFLFKKKNLLRHIQTTNSGTRPGNQETSDMAVFISLPFMSEHTIYTDLCALSGYVCVLTILCLFVIKLVQTCRARPPRAVTQTPSSLSKKKKKSLVLIISILWACLCPKQTSEAPTPPPTGHKPHRNVMVKTFR